MTKLQSDSSCAGLIELARPAAVKRTIVRTNKPKFTRYQAAQLQQITKVGTILGQDSGSKDEWQYPRSTNQYMY